MNTINIQRLKDVILWNSITAKREMRNIFLTFTACFSMYTLILFISNITSRTPVSEYQYVPVSAFLILVIGAFLLSRACMVMSRLMKKGELAAYLLLPATQGEKFLALIVRNFFVMLLVMLAAVVASDIIVALMTLLFCGSAKSITLIMLASFADTLADVFTSPLGAVLAIIATMCSMYSYCLMCGTLFRKHPILFAVGIAFLIPWVIVMFFGIAIAPYVDWELLEWLENTRFGIWLQDPDNMELFGKIMAYTFFVVLPSIMTVVFTWVSFKAFKRTQLINNRIINW